MEKRRFGRTGHESTVAIFGAVAFAKVTQDEADKAMAKIIRAGVNHIDVAPSYGEAELRLGPWLGKEEERRRFFLGCKTTERSREKAKIDLHHSLERLQVSALDLYQLHAVTTIAELDEVTGPGGALETLIEAREQGLTRYLGITGHGLFAPSVFLEALQRFDFDTILFPVNFVLFSDPSYRSAAEELLRECRTRDVGVMAIKATGKARWHARTPLYDTWYEPFEDPARIADGVNFTLSHDITGLCTAGDIRLLPQLFEACERFKPLTLEEQEQLIGQASLYEPLFIDNQLRI